MDRAERLTGSNLGVYQVEALIGAGAMGEVYRARDTKLGRTVAIKVLPDSFTDDPERLARFEREARALAALNHPNIATIHGLEDFEFGQSTGAATVRGLVLELVEGETLDDRIRSGLTCDQALGLARQSIRGRRAGIALHRPVRPVVHELCRLEGRRVLHHG
jgi:serine/threonine protein kinase